MNHILSEKEYQRYIIERLVTENGYIERKAVHYDRAFAIDRELLFRFLSDTQPDTMAALTKIFKDKTEETIINFLNTEVTKARGSLLSVLKHGIEIANYKLILLYTKPATTYNAELLTNYNKNIFSVMEEVWASDEERIDLVIFLNGLAVMSFELKCNFAGQSYSDAILQYRTQRDPKTRLFRFKAGCLVNFAMDLNEVYMTTKLNGADTIFFPSIWAAAKRSTQARVIRRMRTNTASTICGRISSKRICSSNLSQSSSSLRRKKRRTNLPAKRKSRKRSSFPAIINST